MHRQQQGTTDDHEGPHLEKVLVGKQGVGHHPDLEPTGQQPSKPANRLTVSGNIDVSNLSGHSQKSPLARNMTSSSTANGGEQKSKGLETLSSVVQSEGRSLRRLL